MQQRAQQYKEMKNFVKAKVFVNNRTLGDIDDRPHAVAKAARRYEAHAAGLYRAKGVPVKHNGPAHQEVE